MLQLIHSAYYSLRNASYFVCCYMFVSLALEMLHIVNISHITYKDKLNLKIRELFFKKKKRVGENFLFFGEPNVKQVYMKELKI